MVAAIETTNLRKEYGSGVVALHDLSLTVLPGEVFGLLGPNGAGKSTTVKVLAGLLRPTAGDARLFGEPASEPIARRSVGYLPEHFRFHEWLTGEDLLRFHGRLAGLADEAVHAQIPGLLELVGLEGRGKDRLRGYSKGMSQRIGLAQAMLGSPRLVLLDEPTSALDPVGRRDTRELLRHLADEGVAVFLNSHLLTEIELVCDRVAIIDRGRVIRSGRLADLLGGSSLLRVSTDRVDDGLLLRLARFGTVRAVEGTTAVIVADPDAAADVAEAVVAGGYRLRGLVPVRETLEDVFVRLVSRGEGAAP